MTMQVAFRAKCGLVLASDQCGARVDDDVRQTFQIDKIATFGQFAFAFAGADFTRLIADDLRKEVATTGTVVLESAMLRGLQTHLPKEGERGAITSIAHGCLWRTDFTAGWMSTIQEIKSKLVIGDSINSAIFFSEQYFNENLSIESLKRLAAYVICMGHARNPEFIFGLQIVTLPAGSGAVIPVPYDEVRELSEWASDTDKQLRQHFGSF